ncbi:MAG TPA: hypothetical protein VE377_25600 [Candidatus Dormibacteraeota bacterium]|nr:hypothetical protein [Candidatus Dormibacteraeota bacterium]
MARSQINGRDDSIALRLRVAHVMDCASLEPAGLPPSAILLVRHLADPQPRAFLPYLDAIRPGRTWERAAQSTLEDFHRRAARPALGFVPNSCESVLFADPGEMLACLAYDLLHGNSSASWWWQLISRTLCPGSLEGWVAAWRRQPRYVPAALRILSERRAAVELVASLSSAEASSVFAEVVREFGLDLSLTPAVLTADANAHQAQAADSEQHDLASHPQLPAIAEAIPEVARPWSSLLPSALVPPTLEVTQSALLGVSLVLQYAPDAARSHRFSRQFNEWYRSDYRRSLKQAVSAAVEDAAHETGTPFEMQAQSEVVSAAYREPDTRPDLKAPPNAEDGLTRGTGQTELPQTAVVQFSEEPEQGRAQLQNDHRGFSEDVAERVTLSQPTSLTQPPSALAPLEDLHQASPAFPRITNQVTATPHQSAEISSERASTPVLREISLLIEPIPTALGGVLFLVNLMRALRLPECLETEFGVEAINGWTLLELLARCLLGPGRQALNDDPLWTVLAELSERRVPVGDGFVGQERYRLPATWISQLGLGEPADIGVRLRGSRLQLWHSSGFLLLDSTMDPSPTREGIGAECRSIRDGIRLRSVMHWKRVQRPASGGCCALGMTLKPELQRFLAFLLPYVRCRLALALGAVPNRSLDFATALLLRRGSMYVTATHVDLIMGMTQATGPVRLSGLDADPGWIPELGRVVKFSFTSESAS